MALLQLLRCVSLVAVLANGAHLSAQAAGAPKEAPALADLQRKIDRGQAAAALSQLQSMPSSAATERTRGAALYALGRFAEAEKALAAALADNPADLAATQLRGLTLFRLGRPAEAIPFLAKAHTWSEQTKVDPAYVLALCYLDTHRYDDARRAFAEQYGFPPESAPAHLLAARMLLRHELIPLAQEEARKALALDAQLPLAHMLLGEVALVGEHTAEAIAEFEAEQHRNPLNGAVYDRLGDAYTRKGDYPAAQQVLQRAVLLEPNSTGPYILLGKVLLKRGDPATASGYLERAEKMDPANSMTHYLLSQAYRSMGRAEDAQRESLLGQNASTQPAPRLESPK